MKSNYTNPLLFLAFIVALLVHHFWGYLGHYGYDDMEYARLAARFSEGFFDSTNHSSFRLTLVGLTALSYKLFGINDLASSIPALAYTTGSLALVYLILKNEDWYIFTIGLALFSLNNWTFFYSDKLMPDTAVTFFAFLFVYVFYLYKYAPTKMPVYGYSFLAALALFLCFNSKETVVLLAPLVIWLMITDIILKRSGKFWLQFIGFCLIFLTLYLVTCELAFGNAMERFRAIVANSYLNSCSYDQQPFAETLKRITYGLAKLFLIQDMLLGFLVVLSALYFAPVRQWLKLADRKSFFVVSSVVLMLSCNFMSISITSYIPMCPDPRHYLFLVPVVAVAAALILKDHFQSFKFRGIFFILLLVAFAIAMGIGHPIARKLYLPVLLVAGIVLLYKNLEIGKRLFAVLTIAALIFQPADMFIYAGEVSYQKQKEIVQDELIAKNQDYIVITDEVQKRLGYYYSGFNDSARCRFINYAEADTFHFPSNARKILLNNWYTRYLSGMDDQDLPYYATTAENPVFKDEKHNLFIFELKDFARRARLFSTENDFESEKPFWKQSSGKSNEQVYAGSYSEKPVEFSSSFSISLDTLNLHSISQVVVSPKLKIFAGDDAECSVVISMNSNGEQYFWRGFNLSKYVKSKGSWWPASFNEIIEEDTIRNNTTLNVYVWNNKKNEIYIDNFEVEIFSIEN